MIEFSTTSQVTANQGAKIAVYGNAGTGKTSLLATAPNPFIIANEAGLLALKRPNIVRMFGENAPGISYDIPIAKVANCQDLRTILAAFESGVAWTKPFKTLCLDSISQISESELTYQMTQTPNGQKAYGQMADEVLEVIRLFVKLHSMNVVFVAKQNVSSASGLFSAAFPGKLMDFNLPYEFDAILQMVIGDDGAGKTFRYLRTVSDFKNFAKDRTGTLNPDGEPPFLYNIFSKISAA